MSRIYLLVTLFIVAGCVNSSSIELTDYEENKINEFKNNKDFKSLSVMLEDVLRRSSTEKTPEAYTYKMPSFIDKLEYRNEVFSNSEKLTFYSLLFYWRKVERDKLSSLFEIQQKFHPLLEEKQCLKIIKSFRYSDIEKINLSNTDIKKFEDILSICSDSKEFENYSLIFILYKLFEKNKSKAEALEEYKKFINSHPMLPASLLHFKY